MINGPGRSPFPYAACSWRSDFVLVVVLPSYTHLDQISKVLQSAFFFLEILLIVRKNCYQVNVR